MDKPAPDFFEGALLGNGGMGAVVTTRPDAVVIHFGHNNIWDIRIAENNKEKLGTFQEVFDKVKQIPDSLKNLTDDPWYRQYNAMTAENYSHPYPRPFPAGTLVLGFDRRKIELIGHELDISTGICFVKFLDGNGHHYRLRIFVNMQSDQLWMQYEDAEGMPIAHPFDRVRLIPDPSTPQEFPKYTVGEDLAAGTIYFKQVLPASEGDPSPRSAKDKAFRLTLRVNGSLHKASRINWDGNTEEMASLEAAFVKKDRFLALISLDEGLEQRIADTVPKAQASLSGFREAMDLSHKNWMSYWNKSAVRLDDDFLTSIWYRNLYFLHCSVKQGVTAPGLFANWSYNTIGTAWHGDYHMNYNTQQPYWVTFSSNHLEKNLPYVDLIEFLMPVSRKWAREYYQLPGMYIPHSAYPVDMTINPYPIPDWGWEISETPWAVQGLWWHYLYSMDLDFLRNRAFVPIKEAVQFLVAYMERKEACDPARWKDNKYHIFPTVPSELYGLRPGFQFNYDGIADLTLTKFVFKAFQESTKVLGYQKTERNLLQSVERILSRFPEYAKATSVHGDVMASVKGEKPNTVYNVPLPLFTVFPGEEYGLHSDPATLKMLENTYLNQRNEGGNDLVFINLQAARLGKLDLETFKRQVQYALLPNGTATDMVMQTGGRYGDLSDYGYMSRMGIWFENFALPAVIDECLLQGYHDTIRLFPNWPVHKDASFENLRTAGAFLVSATLRQEKVRLITVQSESANRLRLYLPKGQKYVLKSTTDNTVREVQDLLDIPMSKGEKISLSSV